MSGPSPSAGGPGSGAAAPGAAAPGAQAPAAAGGGLRARAVPLLLAFIAAAALILALAPSGGGRQSIPLGRSALGFNGLALWLAEQGLEARRFRGGQVLTPERVGLRILPLFDVDLDRLRLEDETPMTATLREINHRVLESKIESLPTVVALPKWRAGVRDLGVAHPTLLIAPADVGRVAAQVVFGADAGPAAPAALLVRRSDGFSERFAYEGRWARLFGAQTIAAPAFCRPVIGDEAAMVFGACERGDLRFFLLVDPDLFNNHGLAQGENAEIALSVARRWSQGRPVLVDDSVSTWSFAGARESGRSWEAFARLFAFPFSALWASFGVLAALTLWRAWRRDRPAERLFAGADRARASKTAAIAAKARLLRLTGRDGALIQAHVEDRLHHAAAEVLGPHRAAGAGGLDQLRRLIAMRSPALAARFDHFRAGQGPPAGASTAELLRHVADFETFIEQVLHEFGRVSGLREPHSRARRPHGARAG